ncbi:acyltransferase family protein [Microbacterium binotii]|uniref:acyltransferase family protein n=1 Tax=Microbacterium binotii TaxID=462710 RepID=UPI001F266611|nr:acyltransferase [Microbacterium binotii]UIN30081.1 acyltransferase [Microbacterium binotii]
MTNRITPDIERRTSRSGRADRRVANRNVEMTPFSGFRGDIGGLRGVAVLLVLTSHLNLGFDNGFVGVDVFFVISGFLITGLMLKEYGASLETGQGGRVSLSSFYARRARRILPAAVLCLVLTVAVANAILNSGAAAEVERDALWSLLFAANIDLIASSTDYFQQGFAVSPLQNFWSLAVEEQFYIVWPTLIVLVLALHGLTVRRRQFRWSTRVLTLVCILVVASFVWSVISATTEPQVGYFSTLTRAWELGIGAGTACLVFMTRRAPSYWWGVVGAMSIIATLVFMPAGMPFPGWVAIFPVVGTALVLASGAARQGPVYAALNIAPLRFFGLVSYSLYLFHWPIIVLFSRLMPDWDMWPRALVLAAASVGVATVSYYLVEKPTLAHLPKFSFEASKSTSGPLAPRLTAIAFSSALALAAVVVFAPVAYEQTAYAHGLSLRAEPATYTPPPQQLDRVECSRDAVG